MASENEDDEPFISLWRDIALRTYEDPEGADPMISGSRSADKYRSLLYLVKRAKERKRISDSCFFDLASDYMSKYAQIVDNLNGLNNYADEALEMSKRKGYAKESKKWVSIFQDATDEEIKDSLPRNMEQSEVPLEGDVQALLKCFRNNDLGEDSTERFLSTNYNRSCANPVADHSGHHGGVNFSGNPSTVHHKQSVVTDHFQRKAPKVLQLQHSYPHSALPSNGSSKSNMNVVGHSNAFEGNPKRKYPSDEPGKPPCTSFKTAREKLVSDDIQKHGARNANNSSLLIRKSLGSRRNVGSGFAPPFANKTQNGFGADKLRNNDEQDGIVDERLKNIDPKMVEIMNNEIMDHGPPVNWEDIAGLEFAKKTIQEIVVWPMLRPDLFTGLRGPPKGILLFGPPGTGKTLIGKCIASQSKSTFFCISASSITSKWVGEGEKLVRALFAVARCHQPAVIFIDEVDSLLTQRSDNEHESSRRIKTEFLVQLDGASTATDERLLIVGATNRPQELDEAARRRLVKRLYIPLPEGAARREIIEKLVRDQNHSLTNDHLQTIQRETDGYSGADMANLCKEAALGPMRDLNFADIEHIRLDQVRPISLQDFMKALKQVRASVSDKDLQLYQDWNSKYGSASF